MSKVARRHSKEAYKRPVKSRALRRLQRSRPVRYMNQFLLFAHDERKKAKEGKLLPAWKAAHRGLGAKWRSLGAGKAKYKKHGKVPAFAAFAKHSEKRKKVLPDWRHAHKGLGAKWRKMDKTTKARYVAAAHRLRYAYSQRMKGYRNKKAALIKSQRKTKLSKRRRSKAKALKSRKESKKLKAIRRRKSRKLRRH